MTDDTTRSAALDPPVPVSTADRSGARPARRPDGHRGAPAPGTGSTASRTAVAVPEPAPLSVALREATRAAHVRAESAPFVARLVAGRLPRTAYTALVANHLAIYRALEDVPAAWAADPVAGPFVAVPGLRRVGPLRDDLAALGVDRPGDLVTDATRRYVARVAAVTAHDPSRWLAHHYVRYLGDLSGGQVVARAVRDAYGASTATSFYDFGPLGPVKPFRDRYRALLDAAPLESVDEVVGEAVDAFWFNRAVFDSLLPG